MTRRARLISVLSLLLAWAPSAWAEPVSPLPGETLEELAERVYGRAEIAALLERAGFGEKLARGQELDLPRARRIPLPRGSSLSRVAAAHTGRAERWRVLAALSGIESPTRLRAGQRVVLPAVLTIRVRPGDSLGRLAHLAWGSSDGADLLASWNRLDRGAWLRVNQPLEVPLPGRAKPAAPPREKAKAPGAEDAAEPKASETGLARRLAQRRRHGEPEGLLVLAEAVLAAPHCSKALKSDAARHAAHALIALGHTERARAVLETHLTTDALPDPRHDSPRLRALWPTPRKRPAVTGGP